MVALISRPESAEDIVAEIAPLGSEGYRNILRNHGVKEPLFGVKIAELKKIQKRIKCDYQLALDLFATGIYDAMYLAGLIADDAQMTKRDLQRWVKGATSAPIAQSTVAWVAAHSAHGREMALQWIDSKHGHVAAAGWSTLCGLVALIDDSHLDITELKQLLLRVEKSIHTQPNQVRSAMNGFVIALGSYVKPLTADAVHSAKKIGQVYVDVGNTACKVPTAVEAINKMKARGALGKKRKTVKC